MDYVQDGSTSIYHDTVSVGGGAAYPQQQQSSVLLGQVEAEPLGNPDGVLQVDISGAITDKDKVTFTVHTTTNLPEFSLREYFTKRTHEEFVWLHDYFTENPEFAGFIIPPAPPKPDFDTSRAKLQRLGESEDQLPKEDLLKMKAELEAEYLAIFKKTVAMHAVFLQRLAAHQTFQHAYNFRVFLEYQDNLSVRNKTRKEKATEFLKSVSKTTDETLRLTSQRDEDPFFRDEKSTLAAYHTAAKEATAAADAATKQRRAVADQFLGVHLALDSVVPKERLYTPEADLIAVLSSFFENYLKTLVRVASDEDLKFSDTLRYYASDTGAAKDLLYRRSRALADYEAANRALDKARAKMKDIPAAEDAQFAANDHFKSLSKSARRELEDFKVRRIKYFHKNLTALAELMIKRVKTQKDMIQSTLKLLKDVEGPGVGQVRPTDENPSGDTVETPSQ